MFGLAMCLFIGLFAFGQQMMGWHDPQGQVQLGLFMSFMAGIICGYRAKA